MQKLINNPDAFVDEMLEGVMLAHSQQLRLGGRAVPCSALTPR